MRSQRGFSLIELLIVVAIILVIAAIAIPNLLQARIAANEASAVNSLRQIRTSEVAYFNTYPTVGFAPTLAALGGSFPCTASSTTACIIDDSLATAIPGSAGKSGYFFGATGIALAGFNSQFVLGASPMTVGSTGNRDFCVTTDNVFRTQMGTGGDVPVNTVGGCLGFIGLIN